MAALLVTPEPANLWDRLETNPPDSFYVFGVWGGMCGLVTSSLVNLRIKVNSELKRPHRHSSIARATLPSTFAAAASPASPSPQRAEVLWSHRLVQTQCWCPRHVRWQSLVVRRPAPPPPPPSPGRTSACLLPPPPPSPSCSAAKCERSSTASSVARALCTRLVYRVPTMHARATFVWDRALQASHPATSRLTGVVHLHDHRMLSAM